MEPVGQPFEIPTRVRYLDVDQQGVAFHMWYLAYFEDARNEFLSARGLPLPDLIDAGCDLRVVHTEIDWRGSARWNDGSTVTVRPAHIGTTSFTLRYGICTAGTEVVCGQTVYVTINRAGLKQPIPDALREILSRETARLQVAS